MFEAFRQWKTKKWHSITVKFYYCIIFCIYRVIILKVMLLNATKFIEPPEWDGIEPPYAALAKGSMPLGPRGR